MFELNLIFCFIDKCIYFNLGVSVSKISVSFCKYIIIINTFVKRVFE